MQIACGYTHYNSQLDYDIDDTIRRADRKMYQNKYTVK